MQRALKFTSLTQVGSNRAALAVSAEPRLAPSERPRVA
jgi:hypothetical protein